jgi:hypothetical protein
MSHEARQWISYDALTEIAGAEAAARDQDGTFPGAAFDGLRRFGLIGSPPLELNDAPPLFRVLAAIGRGDLSVGRIFEGHVNALFLIHTFGRPKERAYCKTLDSAR